VSCQRHAPAAHYTRRKDPRYPLDRKLGWPLEPVWTRRLEEKSFRLCRGSNLDRQVVQSAVRHYTDWATPALLYKAIQQQTCTKVQIWNHKQVYPRLTDSPTSSATLASRGHRRLSVLCLVAAHAQIVRSLNFASKSFAAVRKAFSKAHLIVSDGNTVWGATHQLLTAFQDTRSASLCPIASAGARRLQSCCGLENLGANRLQRWHYAG
jgi:hypothetical protein